MKEYEKQKVVKGSMSICDQHSFKLVSAIFIFWKIVNLRDIGLSRQWLLLIEFMTYRPKSYEIAIVSLR